MTKGYWFINIDVVNPVEFITYADANLDFLKAHNARLLVDGGDFVHKEGIKRHRNVLVEWPSYEAALAAYALPDYQRIVALRRNSAVADMAIVEGYAGDQPSAAPPPESTAEFPLGYWMLRVDVTDPAAYQRYIAADRKAFAEFGAWFLVRGGRSTVVEGMGRGRYVVLTFPDLVSAEACYVSLAYQQAMAYRKHAGEGDLIIVSGCGGSVSAA